MKPFIHGKWHAWESNSKIMLSDEHTKTLRSFTTIDKAVTWLYAANQVEAARALDKHKET